MLGVRLILESDLAGEMSKRVRLGVPVDEGSAQDRFEPGFFAMWNEVAVFIAAGVLRDAEERGRKRRRQQSQNPLSECTFRSFQRRRFLQLWELRRSG